jgi:fluoride exporter
VAPLGRQFVMVGLCGGYTTFSAFSLETLQLLQVARPFAAAANVCLSLAFGLFAVWLGHALAQRVNRP